MKQDRLGDMLGGLLTICLGVVFFLGGSGLRFLGSRGIGPGYFPLILSAMLIGLGLLVILTAIFMPRPGGGILRADPRAILVIFSSIALFAGMTIGFGLLPAVFVTVVFASLAAGPLRWDAFLMAAGVVLVIWLVFLVGLKVPIKAFGVPFG